ncbi:diketogulonate reductase-like aldo/keto reductase [Bifidobacterium commune]|uniref:aldo/keto reductase n=1 Tax=Bifidobacterium commune TaxID=1505727 RepID=UPI0018486F5F|nr:aldo/keto reductase [Bifidobacterium commune]MBB2954928.1 diketogulonate reductase-like aldo/keto reductase [Bifidobacterium commune]
MELEIPNGDLAYNSVRMAIEAGYRHIDTAYVYDNECSVGRAVRDSGVSRDGIFVTTKLLAKVKQADEVQKYFDKTMKHLGLEVLDLHLIHAPCPRTMRDTCGWTTRIWLFEVI